MPSFPNANYSLRGKEIYVLSASVAGIVMTVAVEGKAGLDLLRTETSVTFILSSSVN